jgi:hypothetical protein
MVSVLTSSTVDRGFESNIKGIFSESLWFESMIYHNRGEHANHYTTDAGRPV